MKQSLSLQNLLYKLRQPGIVATLLRGGSIVFIIQVLGNVVGYLLQIGLARWMGASEYGAYSYVWTLAALGSTFGLVGLRSTVLRFVPEYRSKADYGRLTGAVYSSYAIAAGVSISLAVIATVVAFWVNANSSLAEQSLVLLGIWLMPLITLHQLNISIFRSFRNMVTAFLPEKVLRPLLILVGAFLVLLWSNRAALQSEAVLVVTLVVHAVMVIASCTIAVSVLNKKYPGAKPVYESRKLLRVALPLLLVASFSSVLKQTDTIMIGSLLGSRDVGLYVAAFRTSNLASFTLTAISAIAAPMIAETYAEQNLPKLQRLTRRTIQLTMMPSLLATVVIIAGSDFILNIFGRDFVEAKGVLIALSITALVRSTSGPVGYLLDLTGHQDDSARIRFLAAILNVVLNLVGILTWGILGAAIATLIAVIVERCLVNWLVAKRTGIHAGLLSIFTIS